MKGVDRISDLPDPILIHILSFLSTIIAARTSILSTRWRNLFTLVSNLNFELDGCISRWENRLRLRKFNSSTIKSFRCFVDRVLSFHGRTNVDKFRLKFRLKRGKCVDSDSACRWISGALMRGVKHLDLNISLDKFTFPDALFTCSSLVTLKLDIVLVLHVPEDIHFPNLETLHLKSVKFFDDNSVKSLFSSCSNLQDVVIENCSMMNVKSFRISHPLLRSLTIIRPCYTSNCWLTIDAPCLSNFKYIIDHLVAGYSLKNLESIVSADIQFLIENVDLQADARHAATIFREIYRVRSLVLSLYSLELLLSCEPFPAFPTLVELETPYDKAEQLMSSTDKGLETLLSHCPELENLAFRQDVLISLPEEVPSCLSFKVKAIEISNFKEDEDCIRKAKYILENGRALEKLTIRTSICCRFNKLKISQVLFAYPRKSKQCFILIV
ncbi:F-box/LRR-repeat protein At3g58900-like [Hibiscus syriacus]|uniref:F-box/LRR-repeat protein At3g58900-like n=1 Tax=Hibiscus syriacus TaxID=106335 RepID=UPI001923957D|nr:F-box/LRR-repeat protein At3g58900-like [Hibiscus syriacus]